MSEDADAGVILIESKTFSTKRYQNYFKTKSAAYKKLLEHTAAEDIQYILNKEVLKENFEGNLARIDDDFFISILILKAKDLKKQYNITGKKFGIVIETKPIENIDISKK